jgi:hypothetical protein
MHGIGRAEEVSAVFRDYKSWRVGYDQLGFEERQALEKGGYLIVLNIGDQWSDLMGGYSLKTFKLPNPFYYIP